MDALIDFLKSETLSHFIAEHHHDLLVLKKGATVQEAMKLLSKAHVLSAPVVDEDGEYVGCVSANDILKALVTTLEVNLGRSYANECEKITNADLDGLGKFFTERTIGSVLHDADLWMKGDKSTTLMNLLLEGFHIKGTRVHHRVFVCDPAKAQHAVANSGATTVVNIKPGSEKEGASAWLPTDVVSQSDMVALLWEHRAKLGATAEQTIEALEMCEGAVFTVTADTPALAAIHHMAADHKSCVGIVDAEGGKLVGNLSVSDLRDLPPQHFAVMLLPVGELVAILHGKGPSIEAALSGKRLQGAEVLDLLKDLPVTSVKPDATLLQVLETLATKKLHRVYVTDAEGRPHSIITLTDVLRLLARHHH